MVLFYLLSLILFSSTNSGLLFWLMMELNMILFVLFVKSNMSETYSDYLFYIFIQLFVSFLFLMFSFDFFSFDFSFSFMIMILCMKMGMVPFQYWFFKLCFNMGDLNFFLLLTLQKIPLMLYLFNFNIDYVLMVLMMNMIVGSFFSFSSKNYKELLIWSSFYVFIWFYFFWLEDFTFFIIFYIFYSFHLSFLLNLSNFMFLQKKDFMLFISSIVFLIGIPPFIFFFVKFLSVSLIYSILDLTFILLLLFSVILITTCYLKTFYFSLLEIISISMYKLSVNNFSMFKGLTNFFSIFFGLCFFL